MVGVSLTELSSALQTSARADHGAIDFAELEGLDIDPGEVIDFSVNSNPYGPSPCVSAAVRQVVPHDYPDPECTLLRRALAEHLAITSEQIVVGNGTAELLWLLSFAFLRSGDDVVVLAPTFGEYERCARLMGAQVHEIRTIAESDFCPDTKLVTTMLTEVQPRLAFICNPANPAGTVLEVGIINRWAREHPHTLFVVDEAYLPFVPDMTSSLTLALPNILVMRSMTKDYALAGLRLGYAAGPEYLIQVIASVRPHWNVNAVAQAAGLAGLTDVSWLKTSLEKLNTAKTELTEGLRRLQFKPVPSATHYFIVDVGNGGRIRSRLLARRLQVRDCASFGLPGYVRIATRRPEANIKLLHAIEEIS